MDVAQVTVQAYRGTTHVARPDALAVEEPLELRVGDRSVAITMRTPGHDEDLAVGFLHTEGILKDLKQLLNLKPCKANVVRVTLTGDLDLKKLERHFYTTSSCGVCGKTSLEALAVESKPLGPGPRITPELVHQLPARLREAQAVFDRTGGLHAAALFSPTGELLLLREDVGRHNAVDKVIGAWFREGKPFDDTVLLVSGRASFELVQKSLVAGIPVMAAVGAPSSLAVELAKQGGLTLLGFVRDGRFNAYAGEERLA
ncbi:MAG: formate dehydrogenase family accessory protein FdhD [Cyanobacteria bacterium RYN_339]|nr:formate dehydrogenase family accessory protein FdhD [Cyanobacteria bacterium RYN_339]